MNFGGFIYKRPLPSVRSQSAVVFPDTGCLTFKYQQRVTERTCQLEPRYLQTELTTACQFYEENPQKHRISRQHNCSANE